MVPEPIDSYPWFLNKSFDLTIDDLTTHLRIHTAEWAEYWRPLLDRLQKLLVARDPGRLLVAVGGPPGAGKSTFANILQWIITKGAFHKQAHAVALPMDGFHYPQSFLDTHGKRHADGTTVPLAQIKGHPDTFNVRAIQRYIEQLVARPENMPWPGYSRAMHDIVADKYHVHTSANVVIVEGNYMLLNSGAYASIPPHFHLKIYVDAPGAKIIARLVDRHVAGGKELEAAKDWVRRVDLPNARIAESTKANADVIIECHTGEQITGVIWKNETIVPKAQP